MLSPASFYKLILPLFIVASIALPLSAAGESELSFDMPTSKILKNPDGTMLYIRIAPNEHLIEETLKTNAGVLISKFVRNLNDDNFPVTGVKTDANNQIVSRHRYLYLKGKLIEEEIFDPRGRLASKMAFYYTPQGKLNRVEQYNAQGNLISTTNSTPVQLPPATDQPTTPSRPR